MQLTLFQHEHHGSCSVLTLLLWLELLRLPRIYFIVFSKYSILIIIVFDILLY